MVHIILKLNCTSWTGCRPSASRTASTRTQRVSWCSPSSSASPPAAVLASSVSTSAPKGKVRIGFRIARFFCFKQFETRPILESKFLQFLVVFFVLFGSPRLLQERRQLDRLRDEGAAHGAKVRVGLAPHRLRRERQRRVRVFKPQLGWSWSNA